MASKFLNDLLKFKPEDFGKIKIRFNQPEGIIICLFTVLQIQGMPCICKTGRTR